MSTVTSEYKCGNCREIFVLSPKSKFCPECGSSSLNLIIKELKEPPQKESLGVYSPAPDVRSVLGPIEPEEILGSSEPDVTIKLEEDQPRRPRRR